MFDAATIPKSTNTTNFRPINNRVIYPFIFTSFGPIPRPSIRLFIVFTEDMRCPVAGSMTQFNPLFQPVHKLQLRIVNNFRWYLLLGLPIDPADHSFAVTSYDKFSAVGAARGSIIIGSRSLAFLRGIPPSPPFVHREER